ncbi:alpha/beta-hydrolase [Lepidopterella palustris CBS 459.81]|uniref:Alpha/beta-hydrolase n=1 Tax=Lepidopterella palustris CBS 459.81 TaxID=1314670 RepID=A0A8E2ED89_9PEZI|nr:alpha/beta-hydrolase [Lepidopterella palustris CBS 459.81]
MQETPCTRKYFYTGGHYADDGTGNHIFKDQMYVEQLTPLHTGPRKPYPIVFIHGQAQTGTNWLNKPDGNPGWASYFLLMGYECFIVDQTHRARSAWCPTNSAMTTHCGMATYSAEVIQQRFTAPQRYDLWPQASLHTQWPGEGVMGDKVFDAYYSSNVQFLKDETYTQLAVQDAGAALLDRIGRPVILIAHSQGAMMPWLIADVRPQLVRCIVALEPKGPPFQEAVFSNLSARAYGLTDAPLTYDPPVSDPMIDLVKVIIPSPSPEASACILQAEDPPPRQLIRLRQIPVLVLTAEASYHAVYDWCTVEYLRQAGVKTDHLELGKVGIHGNGHLMFLEKNSDQVAGEVRRWMEANFKYPCKMDGEGV